MKVHPVKNTVLINNKKTDREPQQCKFNTPQKSAWNAFVYLHTREFKGEICCGSHLNHPLENYLFQKRIIKKDSSVLIFF